MAVYDVIPFFNELDLLEVRMEILNPYVDYFVVGESTKTFSGKDKELYFKNNRERFKKFDNKIIVNVFDRDNIKWNQWQREAIHRNSPIEMLKQICKDDDIILTSDADEIPNLETLSLDSFYKHGNIFFMMQKLYYYFINLFKEDNWYGTKICSFEILKKYGIDGIRKLKSGGIKIDNGGWHFSFLGGVDKIIEKIEAYSHQEYNNEYIKNNIFNNVINNKDIFFRANNNLKLVEIDESYPKYIRENIERYSYFVKDVNS